MSFFTRWFRKPDSENYEEILAGLASDIHKRQTRLAEIRLRERRATLTVTLWCVGVWFVYVGIWWMGLLPHWGRRLSLFRPRIVKSRPVEGQEVRYGQRVSQWESVFEGSWLIIGPILILLVRRLVQIWYKRIGDAEEKTLKRILQQQRVKVEEIKKKTNYYSTRNLIERYDEAAGGATAVATPTTGHRLNVPHSVPGPQPTAINPLRPGQGAPGPPRMGPGGVPMTPQNARAMNMNPNYTTGLRNQLQSQPQTPLPPARKQWYDKVADALLGDDDSSAGSGTSRYALICSKCFAHNGLVKESVWEETQYMCPKCGHFNESAKAKKTRLSPQPSPVEPPHEPQQNRTARKSMQPSSALPGSPEGLNQRRGHVDGEDSMEIDS